MGACQWSGVADGDDVDIFGLERLAEVLVGLRGLAHGGVGLAGELRQDRRIDIADVRDAGIRLVGRERGKVRVGAAVQADDGEVHSLISAQDRGVAFGGQV